MLLRYYWFFFILHYFRIEAFLYTYFVRKKIINICDIYRQLGLLVVLKKEKIFTLDIHNGKI